LRLLKDDGTLNVVCVSHVDADHITGVLDLLAVIERDRANGRPPLRVDDLWHNGFAEAIDTPDGRITLGLEVLLDAAGQANVAMPDGSLDLFGIAEGARLHRSAARLAIPINRAFGGGPISPDYLADPVRTLGEAKITVVGPTRANLEELQREWLLWLESHAHAVFDPTQEAFANADRSIPNLSSIVLHVAEGTRSLLLTGDARGDHILQGLAASGLLTERLHVNTLKVQHHGSDRNATYEFFRKVTADRYVVSANGRYGNPDHATLRWIIESAQVSDREIEIFVTNHAPALDEIRRTHPPTENGYALSILQGDGKSLEV
jgi:hypothetical protein